MRSPAGAVVCVPARDEAERLPALIASLGAQTGFTPDAPLGLVIVANGCTDETAAVARTAAAAHPGLSLHLVEATLPPDAAHVGTARRMALDLGAEWLEREGMPDGILLCTDADARLPADWAAANLEALRDAEVVGGALVIAADREGDDDLARLNEAIAAYWQAVRAIDEKLDPSPHDPAPRHGDHTGASLALRASLYRAIGGLPPLPGGEDNALVAKVVESGGRLRHDPAVRVHVSDRAVGRATGGMAQDMARRRAVARGEEAYLLPHPALWLDVIERRVDLRRSWRRGPGPAAELLRRLGLDEAAIAAIDPAACPNDIAFVERASARLPGIAPKHPDLPVEEALAQFLPILEGIRGAA